MMMTTLDTSVGKALALLGAFDGRDSVVTLTTLAQRAGVPKSTAHRLLGVLDSNGYVCKRGGGYSVGRRLFELGSLASGSWPDNLRSAATPYLMELYETTHLTVHLAVLDRAEVLYLEKVFGHQSGATPTRVGGRVPATCTALGKAILAFSDDDVVRAVLSKGLRRLTPYSVVNPALFATSLARVKDTGISSAGEESLLGLNCIGAPLLDATGRAVAAISLSGPGPSMSRYELPLRRAADGLTERLCAGHRATRRRTALTA